MQTMMIIDIGTTAVKMSIYDESLALLRDATIEYQLITAENAIAEFDAEDYWRHLCTLAQRLEVSKLQVAGICVTTQGETLIAVDAAGKPLCNALVWLDGRAVSQGKKITSVIGTEAFYVATGIPECNGFCPVSKLLWFKEERPLLYERTAYFLLLEDFILFRLTGRFVTEKSLLTTTGYFHLGEDRVWVELLDLLSLDASKLPPALECGEPVGELCKEAMQALGLTQGVCVIAGAMDQVAGAIGAGNIVQGIVSETTGTALCIGATLHKTALQAGWCVPVYRHFRADRYLALPVCLTAGMVLKWFKDLFCEKEQALAKERGCSVYDLLSEEAAASKPLAGGLTLLPYFAGCVQPEALPAAKGVFYGVTLDTQKKDFVRAIMEGVGYMLRENVELLTQRLKVEISEVRSMGGGAKSAIWNGVKANILGKPVALMRNSECTSAGAAALCATALGWYESEAAACAQANQIADCILPEAETALLYEQGYQQFRALYTALRGMFAKEQGGKQ
ncbi:MAG: FGGY family carbohydrate kinase [Clostridia bacterium]